MCFWFQKRLDQESINFKFPTNVKNRAVLGHGSHHMIWRVDADRKLTSLE